MTDYALTTQSDNFTGTDDADVFSGPPGGTDTLNGAGGADLFVLNEISRGSVDGGSGVDTVQANVLWGLQFQRVEVLTGGNFGIFSTGVAQLAKFNTITANTPISEAIELYLERAAGGTLDLSTRITDGHGVTVIQNTLTSSVNLAGTSANDTLFGTQFGDVLNGRDGDDAIVAGDQDVINGEGGNDTLAIGTNSSPDATLKGGDGDDFIGISSGIGTIDGGIGYDIISALDISGSTISGVEELRAWQTIATVQQISAFSTLSSQSGHIDVNLVGTGGVIDLAGRLALGTTIRLDGSQLTSGLDATGGDGDDWLIGSIYGDTLRGGTGDDSLTASIGDNLILGGAGADTLTSGNGTDTLEGGDNNDLFNLSDVGTYVVSGGAGDDHFNVGGGDGNIDGGDGTDRVNGDLSHIALQNVEVLDQYGTVSLDQLFAFESITNSYGPDDRVSIGLFGPGGAIAFASLLEPGHGVDMRQGAVTSALSITGTGLGDRLIGSSYSDSLRGAAGNDTLFASDAGDTLVGGLGNDHYFLYALGATIREDAGAGRDMLRIVDHDIDLRAFRNIEDLELVGSTATNGTGSGTANLIVGGYGRNALSGLGGNDTIYGGTGGDDTIAGGDGDDLLDGESNVENLSSYSDDSLDGGAGADTLYGGEGNDTLHGGTGDDVMNGYAGNDTYFVDSPGDTINESVPNIYGGGIDTVYSMIDFTLSGNLDNLRLQGTTGRTGTGNKVANKLFGTNSADLLLGLAGNDTIDGKDGADTIEGGAGNDTITGGGGLDVYRFTAANAGIDTITDFSRNFDKFDLSGGTFTALSTAPNGDAVLTHTGGAIRIQNPPNLTLAQWNALVIPSGGKAVQGSGGGDAHDILANAFYGADDGHHAPAHARNDIFTLGHGDWAFA